MRHIRPQAERNPFVERKRKTVLVIFSVVVMMSLSLIYLLNQKEEPLSVTYQVGDLSQDEIVEKFMGYQFEDLLEMKDYFFYGETLSLFDQEYNIFEKSELLGKTIVLENVNSDDEYFYLIDQDVDGQIPLAQLPEGLYEVFINVNLIKQRVVTSEKLTDQINLVKRANELKTVELIANKNMFDDRENKNVLDKNFLFINVKSSETSQDDYDIVLDPEHGTNANGWFKNTGLTVAGLNEAEQNYEMATLLKKELEKAGLKILITRNDNEEIINIYGEDGRLNRAYDSNAKYYIELGWGRSDFGGLRIYNSSFASIQLAGFVAKHLLLETNLSSQNDSGVYPIRRFNGLDGLLTIREVGGKALAAATVSDVAKEQNSSFALNNRHGLEAISIEYISGTNEKQVNMWKDNKEIWAKETAVALINFLDIGGSNDLSD